MKQLIAAIQLVLKALWNFLGFMRSLFFNLIFVLIAGLILASFFYQEEITIADQSILKLKISGKVVEKKSENDPIADFIYDFFGLSTPVQETLLQDILDVVSHAEDDPKIRALLLDLSDMGSVGMNQLDAIGSQLKAFSRSGKKVIAAEDFYNQDQYYLAAFADRVFLNPMGAVYLSGFGSYRLYYKDAIEKLKINYHVFKVGSFKSALEPLTRNSMSPEDRYQSRTWLNALWQNYVRDVARERGIAPESVISYINSVPVNLREANGNLAQLALNSNLVDEILPRHEVRKYLAEISGNKAVNGFTAISSDTYLKTVYRSHRYQGEDKDSIALIVAQGTIIPGKSRPGSVGADTIASLIRQAANADSVKAVLLRIDSGGGSAFASELIRQELLQLKATGKPVVVSMGRVAASGAYWIAADADQIFAAANSLTGSIGIFMAIPTFENSLTSFGVYRDGVGTTNLSEGISLAAPLSSEIKQAIQLTLEHGYKTFLDVVATGRSLEREELESIADGRVFDGNSALEAGLIDTIGSLSDAVMATAERAGLDDYRVKTLHHTGSFKNRLLNLLDTSSLLPALQEFSLSSLLSALLPNNEELQSLLLFRDPNGMYAHCVINY